MEFSCNNGRDKHVRHCTTSSRQLRSLPDRPLHKRTRTGPPDAKVYLLFPTCRFLWKPRGVRGSYQMEIVPSASHVFAIFHCMEYGTWHLHCSGVDGLTEEWLRRRRGIWRWEPLASWQYLPFPNPVSAPSYPFKEETSLPRVLRFWGAWWHPFVWLQPPVAAALGAGVVQTGDPQPPPLKEGLCLNPGCALPAVSMFRPVWLVHLLFCSLSPSLKNKLPEQLRQDKREGWDAGGS